MINGVWLFLLAGGIIWGLITGNGTVVMQSALGGAETAVTLSIKLVGVMCLWLGMLKICADCSTIDTLAVSFCSDRPSCDGSCCDDDYCKYAWYG